ncbi:hypothetical protein PSTG_18140 [Puccinia striiformis f. sp. tritici PST-78]|uniref:Uncharacterized protein n=1 Tax=Puccinia striiformis f. sp. tritici PST-78 TaxID=1165861 RepID=A0A0L0UNZ6_9BASI|nr:hypothetical protein PSTG_18140 [Puccinia striiformis f. sp. tritici PST-78]
MGSNKFSPSKSSTGPSPSVDPLKNQFSHPAGTPGSSRRNSPSPTGKGKGTALEGDDASSSDLEDLDVPIHGGRQAPQTLVNDPTRLLATTQHVRSTALEAI